MNALDLVEEEFIKAQEEGKPHITVGRETIQELDRNFIPILGIEDRFYWFRTFYSRPVISVKDVYIIYLHCAYCGSPDLPIEGLYGTYVCQHCGAAVS